MEEWKQVYYLTPKLQLESLKTIFANPENST